MSNAHRINATLPDLLWMPQVGLRHNSSVEAIPVALADYDLRCSLACRIFVLLQQF
jgi:hypothetical protein